MKQLVIVTVLVVKVTSRIPAQTADTVAGAAIVVAFPILVLDNHTAFPDVPVILRAVLTVCVVPPANETATGPIKVRVPNVLAPATCMTQDAAVLLN